MSQEGRLLARVTVRSTKGKETHTCCHLVVNNGVSLHSMNENLGLKCIEIVEDVLKIGRWAGSLSLSLPGRVDFEVEQASARFR